MRDMHVRLLAVVVCVVACANALLPTTGYAAKKQKVTMDQLPQPVQETLKKEAGDATITSLKAHTKGGQTHYEAEWISGGKSVEIEIAADGKIIEKKTIMPLDDVPAPVKETILREAGNAQPIKVKELMMCEVKTYEAEWVAGGQEVEIKVLSDGKLMSKDVD